ncbi:MAG TPA: NAD(P)H-binding protein [Candidatus Saccharimonadales bacterium]|jgi:putative NADH-flavin reductase
MRITVFGASGKVGTQVTALLLAHGHDVTVFVHSTPVPAREHLQSIKGDIHEPSDVDRAIAGADAVICVLGSWGTKSKDIVSSATANLIPAMESAGIRRIVTLTGSGARSPGEKPGVIFDVMRAAFGKVAPKILKDSEDHLDMLAGSSLEFTVLRSPPMLEAGTQQYQLGVAPKLSALTIHRGAVAAAIVGLVEQNSHLRQYPYISRG